MVPPSLALLLLLLQQAMGIHRARWIPMGAWVSINIQWAIPEFSIGHPGKRVSQQLLPKLYKYYLASLWLTPLYHIQRYVAVCAYELPEMSTTTHWGTCFFTMARYVPAHIQLIVASNAGTANLSHSECIDWVINSSLFFTALVIGTHWVPIMTLW